MTRAYNTATTQQNSGGAVPAFVAGKNKIINGDFFVNQRGFTSTTTNGAFGFDRWFLATVDGTVTYSAQTFTPGTAPVAGYEGINFARIESTGQTLASSASILRQHIEDVRTFAGQTVTISFWAKATTGTPKISFEFDQQFGSGGSSRVTTYAGQVTISTSWARYSVTVLVPSVSGKTIGSSSYLECSFWTSAGSNFAARTGTLGIQSATIDFWGVQVEAGSTATAFQTATGTIQGELAACQRYYCRLGGANASDGYYTYGTGYTATTTKAYATTKLPVTMRTSPAFSSFATASSFAVHTGTSSVVAASSLAVDRTNVDSIWWTINTAGSLTVGYGVFFINNNNTNAFIELSAEI